jgi:hypothetical protein
MASYMVELGRMAEPQRPKAPQSSRQAPRLAHLSRVGIERDDGRIGQLEEVRNLRAAVTHARAMPAGTYWRMNFLPEN